MAATTPTDYWNDSCSVEELTYAIENGAVGATTNPTIVLDVLKKEMHLWRERIYQIIRENPTWNEDQITWQLIEEMAVKGAELLLPVFEREAGPQGPPFDPDQPDLLPQRRGHPGRRPCTSTAWRPTCRSRSRSPRPGSRPSKRPPTTGININATVCFCVPQALAVAEAVERGLQAARGGRPAGRNMRPVCTIMIGRMDDWIHVLEKRDGIAGPARVPRIGPGSPASRRPTRIFQAARLPHPPAGGGLPPLTCTGPS